MFIDNKISMKRLKRENEDFNLQKGNIYKKNSHHYI